MRNGHDFDIRTNGGGQSIEGWDDIDGWEE